MVTKPQAVHPAIITRSVSISASHGIGGNVPPAVGACGRISGRNAAADAVALVNGILSLRWS